MTSVDPIKKISADCEHINGAPEILSSYGFKKIEFNGKKYLVPMSIEEAIDLISKVKGISKEDAKKQFKPDHCRGGGVSSACYKTQGCTYCEPISDDMSWVCLCE